MFGIGLNQNFPQNGEAFVDQQGRLTLNAIALLRTLWNRTGYAPGVSSDDLALFSALQDIGPTVDQAAREQAQGALLTALQGQPVSVDPQAREDAQAAFLTALAAMQSPVPDDTDAKMFALSLMGPIFSAPASAGGGLTPTGVTPGTYGDASNVGQFTVNAFGQITAAADVPISGTGGASWFPMVDGAEPPAFITDGAGVLIAVAYAP